MNMFELRSMVYQPFCFDFDSFSTHNFLKNKIQHLTFRSCKPSQLTLDWLMGSYCPIDLWNSFGKQPRSNSFLVSHLMSYSWLMCFFSVKFSPIDLFHRFRLLVFFLETPILLCTMIVEGSFFVCLVFVIVFCFFGPFQRLRPLEYT